IGCLSRDVCRMAGVDNEAIASRGLRRTFMEGVADLADRVRVVQVDQDAREAQDQAPSELGVVVLEVVTRLHLELQVDATVDLDPEGAAGAAPERGVEIAASARTVEPQLELRPREAVPAAEREELDLAQRLGAALEVVAEKKE